MVGYPGVPPSALGSAGGLLGEPRGQTGVCLFVTLAPGAQEPRQRKLYE